MADLHTPTARARFTVTYDVVTEDSARDGDVAEHGYAHPRGWRVPLDVDPFPTERYTLREAIEATDRSYSRRYGCGFEDGGRSFYTVDGDQDYRTGEETRYAIHPPEHITASSYARVARILTGRR